MVPPIFFFPTVYDFCPSQRVKEQNTDLSERGLNIHPKSEIRYTVVKFPKDELETSSLCEHIIYPLEIFFSICTRRTNDNAVVEMSSQCRYVGVDCVSRWKFTSHVQLR